MEENSEKQVATSDIKRQMVLYFSFAACMIVLNYVIQKINQLVVAQYICTNFGDNG